MATTDYLLEAAADIWQAYYDHPFIKGIENGDLDKEKFRFYILQDYLYLQEYAKVFALGVAKAKTVELADLFAGYIPAINAELTVHSGFMTNFGVTPEDALKSDRSLANLSYTSYMLRIAYEEGEAEILAAILSCALSYESIAKRIVANRPDSQDDPFYGPWIKNYAGSEYCDPNVTLVETLNRITEDYTETQLVHLKDVFVACSRYELDFWEMGWQMTM